MGSFFIESATITGLNINNIKVEIDISNGLPGFIIVGLPDTAINESRERIRAALKNSGFAWPRQKIVINLSPANIKKSGPQFDLAIALAVILTAYKEKVYLFKNTLIFGELGLNGDILPIQGTYALVEHAYQAQKSVIIPTANATEAGLQENIRITTISHLTELITLLQSNELPHNITKKAINHTELKTSIDFSEIKGQEFAKRALIIAASGNHNLMLSGPPGTGKTLLAKAMTGILPPPNQQEIKEILKIKSIAGQKINEKTPLTRPFRSPHHSSSSVALVGGGRIPMPGEVTLAHRGILFLDELPEFSKHTLNQLRQPIEDGEVNISRSSMNCTYPSKFILFAAMNPCPCGHLTNKKVICSCTPSQIQKYQSKISGPILDRIDIHVEMDPLNLEDLINDESRDKETSQQIREEIIEVQLIQKERYKETNFNTNADLDQKSLKKFCLLSDDSINLIKQAFEKSPLSGRAYARLLKTARTIADLEKSHKIQPNHIAEALSYRYQKKLSDIF